MNQYPVLSKGDRGSSVELLQKRLNDWGCDAGSVDGVFGDRTFSAVKDFQSKRQGSVEFARGPLAVDGVVGAETWAELVKVPVEELAIVRAPVLITKAQAVFVFGRSPSINQLGDLNVCLSRFDITTTQRMRHFLAQIAHESGGLRWLQEIWGPSAAQRGYQGRGDLGNLQPGDGYRFRGAGAIQLTGRYNYTAFSRAIADPKVVEIGANYVSEVYPFTSAGWFWQQARLNQMCDRPDVNVSMVTRVVNGGLTNLSDRIYYYNRACHAIK